MNKELMTTLGLLVIALIAVLGAFLSRPTITVTSSNPGLSVSGTSKVSIVPDIAKLTAGVVAQGTTVAVAQKKANDTTDQIKKTLFGLKVDKKDIQTQNYYINPLYDSQSSIPRIREYEVRHELTLTVRDLDKVDPIIEAVTGAGANTISNIHFTVDDPEEFLVEAREEAIKKARAKAESSAKLSGASLGGIITMNEYLSGPFPPDLGYYAGYGRGGEETPAGIEPGATELELTVNITYSLR